MEPKVSIIMGSTSDMKVMEQAAAFLEQMEIPFEINALSLPVQAELHTFPESLPQRLLFP